MWRSAAEDRSWLIEALIVYLTLHVLREKHNKNQEKPRGMATKTYLSSSVRGSFTYVEVPTWYKSSLSLKIFSLSREKRAILGGGEGLINYWQLLCGWPGAQVVGQAGGSRCVRAAPAQQCSWAQQVPLWKPGGRAARLWGVRRRYGQQPYEQPGRRKSRWGKGALVFLCLSPSDFILIGDHLSLFSANWAFSACGSDQ